MKKYMLSLLATLICLTPQAVQAQKIVDLGIFKKASDASQLEIRLRPAQDVTNAPYSAGIFTVRFPSDYGVTLMEVPGSSPYGYSFAGPMGQLDGYDYYRYQFAGSVYFVNWEKNKEYPVLTLQVNGNLPPNPVFELVTNEPYTKANNADYYQELNGQELERKFYKLPVKFTMFNAKATGDRDVRLDWEFESETELLFTEIEYSMDGENFDQIGKTPGQYGATEYDFLHRQVPADANFYRVRMVDVEGIEFYSPIRLINFADAGATEFSVFPNPTSGPVTLYCKDLSKYDGKVVNYQIVDNSGRILRFERLMSESLNLQLNDLTPGTYLIRVLANSSQVAEFKVIRMDN